ncbi:MAG: radical SAM protein [Desulfomonilia bacterium]|jgi:MoaA/NifB/PqqE/SkfB family radical SAM enzyme
MNITEFSPKWGNWFLRNLDKVDYECVFELTTSCNYHCEYCSNGRGRENEDVSRRGQTQEDIQKIINFFDSNQTWHIVIGGGEPSIHPMFYDLVGKLSKKHYISIYTNLSLDLERLLDCVPHEKIVSVRCTLHNLKSENIFFQKIERLKKANFNPAMVFVATPERINEIDRIASRCNLLGIPLSIFPLAGPYRSKIYPHDYDQKTKDFLLERPSLVLYPGHLIRLLSNKEGLVTAGFQCTAGSRFFSIHAESGAIDRCEGVRTKIGNIYTGEFLPMHGATECPSSCCIDYCFADDLTDQYYQKFFSSQVNEKEMVDKAILFAKESMERLDVMRKIMTEKAHQLIKGKKTLLWGSGMAGSFFLQAYSDLFDVDHIIGFVDTNDEKWGHTIYGKEIFPPRAIATIKPDVVLICAPAFENEIFEMAHKWVDSGVQVLGLEKDVTRSLSYGF